MKSIVYGLFLTLFPNQTPS